MNATKLARTLESAEAYLQDKHQALWAHGYGEPGYADPPRGILLANWNDVPRGLADWLERQGFGLEWFDEWTICDNGKAWRTSPDSYAWESSLVYGEGFMLTRDDDHAEIIDTIAMTDYAQQAECVPSWIDASDLQDAGYTLHAVKLESGFHPGQTDDPAKIAREAFEAGAERVVFRKVENSQFYIVFDCWCLMPADPFEGSFLRPSIEHGEYFQVNTSAGTEVVPADVLSLRVEAVQASVLRDYLEGAPDDPDEIIERKTGWLARLSAPGYLDCTAWTAHASEGAARAYLNQAL
jgi:hypothetical protein